MSSEAGSAFPLSRLSVFDLSPLSPVNKAADSTAAAAATILRTEVSDRVSPEGAGIYKPLLPNPTPTSPLNHPSRCTHAQTR